MKIVIGIVLRQIDELSQSHPVCLSQAQACSRIQLYRWTGWSLYGRRLYNWNTGVMMWTEFFK